MTIKIRRALKRMRPHLLEARENNLNEADTVLRLIRFFEQVLGYDPMSEISREAVMKRQYIDILIKTDGTPQIIVEAKAARVKLRDRHIDQAQAYAAKNNYQWVLLTNGVQWILYHLEFDEGIEFERVFDVNLAEEKTLEEAIEALAHLHRDVIRKGGLEDYWEKRTALSPASIGRALFTEDVLMRIRREVRRQEGVLVDPEDLASALKQLLTPETWESLGNIRVKRRRKRSRSAKTRTASKDSETPIGLSAPHPRPSQVAAVAEEE